jgi:hypothetical protein
MQERVGRSHNRVSRKQRAVWGIIVPCFFGWGTEILFPFLLSGAEEWNLPFLPNMLLVFALLAYLPLGAILMGFIHGLFYLTPLFSEDERYKAGQICFWIFQSPPLLFGFYFTLASFCDYARYGLYDRALDSLAVGLLIVFPLWLIPVAICGLLFALGRRWGQNFSIPIYLGLKNEWERNDDD